MALQWQWKEQSGTIQLEGKTYPFYEGNAFMIVLHEFKDEKGEESWQMMYFFVDKSHAKRCLGLEKGSYDMFEGNVEKITIYKNHCHYWKDIVDLFTKTQPDIEITILPQKKEVAE